MKELIRWKQAARNGLAPGLVVAAATTLAVAACGKRENNDAVTPLNDISHIVWGDDAFDAPGFSLRHTVPGVLLNAAASLSWAIIFARFFGPAPSAATASSSAVDDSSPDDFDGRRNGNQSENRSSGEGSRKSDRHEFRSSCEAASGRGFAARALCGGMVVSGLAYIVDYHVVSSRLRPGFERHLSRRALLWIYVALALSLASGGLNRGAMDGEI